MTNLTDALKDPTNHRLIPGLGYVRGNPMPNGSEDANYCYPPAGTRDGSSHFLQPPKGAHKMKFVWLQQQAAWFTLNPRSLRLAYPAEYLSSHGWRYLGSL